MPTEWNEMISAMRVNHEHWPQCMRGIYREAVSDEISEPEDFRVLWQTDDSQTEQLQQQSVERLKPGKGDLGFDKLRAKFEKPKPKQTTPANYLRGSTEPPRDKGKGKDNKNSPTQDEYTPLHTRWRDEYSDIFDGTADTLPPWR